MRWLPSSLRALAHTTARPEGVTIQSDSPGEVLISVRDANFHPVANAPVDVFRARADQVDEAFNEDGSCYTRHASLAVGGNTDAVRDRCSRRHNRSQRRLRPRRDHGEREGRRHHRVGLDRRVRRQGRGRRRRARQRQPHRDDGPSGRPTSAKVTTDVPMGVTRASPSAAPLRSRSSWSATQLRTVRTLWQMTAATPTRSSCAATTDRNIEHEATTAVAADAAADSRCRLSRPRWSRSTPAARPRSTITAADPDPTDSNNADGDGTGDPDTNKIDRVRVSYTVTVATGGRAVADNAISSTGSSGTGDDHVLRRSGRGYWLEP